MSPLKILADFIFWALSYRTTIRPKLTTHGGLTHATYVYFQKAFGNIL